VLILISAPFLYFYYFIRPQHELVIALLISQKENSIFRRPHRKRVRVLFWDRVAFVLASLLSSRWRENIHIVRPETVLRWYKTLFRSFWRWNSRKIGQPRIPQPLRNLIRRIASENPSWGPKKIFHELGYLGHLNGLCLTTVKIYIKRFFPRGHSRRRSQSWATFFKNQLKAIAAIDFFAIPTIRGNFLYGFVVLSHDRRKILHADVTEHPTAEWTLQQLRETFPFNVPKFLIRDNDSIYSHWFRGRVENIGIRQVPTALHSPWQNPYCERVIGTLRRECFDHVIVFNENHARTLLREYIDYYNHYRPHQSLNGRPPLNRRRRPKGSGVRVISSPVLGGLHHVYKLAA
jgi:transposase InsO family protein